MKNTDKNQPKQGQGKIKPRVRPAKVEQSEEERKQAEEALRQRAEELAALQATVLEIASPHDLPSLLHTIVERAARLLNANSGGMYLCGPARDEVHCVVSYNTPRDYTGTVLKFGQGAAGTVAQTEKPLIIDDYRTWGKRADAFEKEQPFSAVLSVPMFWHGQVTGVIHVLHNVETRHFTEADLDLLTQFANHAAVAVENARLYDKAQKEIAERKQAEDSLRESEAQFRVLAEQSITGITVIQENKFVYVNPRLAEMFGYTQDDMIGMKPTDLVVEAHRELVQESLRKRLSGEIPSAHYMFRARRKDGSEIEVEVYGSTLIYQGRSAVLSTLLDITERKRAEEALRAAEEKYRAIFENSIEGIFQSTLEGRFITVNPAFARMLGYASPQETIVTVTDIAQQVYVEAPRRNKFVHLMAEQGSVSGFEFQMHRKDGGTLWVSENVRAVRDAEGRILYYEGTVEDITERKRVEEKIKQRNEELSLLNAINQAVNRGEGLETIIRLIAKETGPLFNSFGVTLHLLSPDRQRLVMQNLALPTALVKKIEKLIGIPIPRIEHDLQVAHPYRQVLESRKPQVINDLEDIQEFTAAYLLAAPLPEKIRTMLKRLIPTIVKSLGYQSVLTVPMIADDEVIGTLDVGRREPFTEEDAKRLETIANQLTTVIKRKRAEEKLQESEKQYRSLFENVLTGVYRTTPEGQILAANPALVSILGYDAQEELLKIHLADLYLEPGDRKNMLIKFQESGIRSAEIGLKRKDGTTIIALDNAHAVRDEQGEVLCFEGTLTDITALKQAEAMLEHQAEELGQRYAELTLLYEAGLTINRELNPRLQLETLFKTAMQALQADHAEFSRYDAARGRVQFEMGIGYSPEVLEKLRALVVHDGEEQGLIGMVAQTHQPLNLPDVHADPHYIEIDPEIRSALWAPVAREKELLGVLGVLSTRPNAFSDQHERLLLLFANQAAVALENARLFAETSRRLKHVQALSTIDMAISSSLDLQVTFDIFLEQVIKQLGVHAVDILKFDPHMQTLEFAAGRGFRTAAIQKSHFRLGEGLAGRAALERRILHIPDLAAEQDGVVRILQFENEGFTAYFGVPLIAKGQVKGVLEIFHREPFTTDQDWIDFLGILAGQAAIAIDNVTLFNDLQRSNVELTLAYDATIEGWSHALDLRDKETEGHTQRVADLTLRLAQAMGVSDHELIHIRRGTLLHDIGKMGIPDEILRKPASLDEQEWVVMRQHPLYAYDMLSPISYLRPAMDIPYCHHEKWDGSGYPRGLAGAQIPLAARLFAVVDVYDALTSDRPYREAWSRKRALEYIQQQAGQHFDPEIVSTFLGMPALHESWNGDKISQT